MLEKPFSIAEKNKSVIEPSIKSNYIRWRFHEESGSNAAYSGILDGSAVSGNSALNGVTTNIWDNRGWITPIAGTGNANAVAATTNLPLEDLLRLDTLSTKGFLCFFTFLWNGTPDASQRVFGYGSLGSRGGWHIQTSVSANVNLQFDVHEVGAAATVSTKVSLGTPTGAGQGVVHTCVIYAEGTDTYLAVDGAWVSADVGDLTGLVLPGRLTNDGIGLLCHTDFNGTASVNELNGDILAGNEAQVHNFTVMRVDLSQTQLATLASQLHEMPREWPWILENR